MHGIFVLYSTKNIIQIASCGKCLGCVGVSGVHMSVRVCACFFLILLILESQEGRLFPLVFRKNEPTACHLSHLPCFPTRDMCAPDGTLNLWGIGKVKINAQHLYWKNVRGNYAQVEMNHGWEGRIHMNFQDQMGGLKWDAPEFGGVIIIIAYIYGARHCLI